MKIVRDASLLYYVVAAQQPSVNMPPASASHSATPLLQEYVSHVFNVEVVPKWSLASIHNTIATVPHTSTLTPSDIAYY